MFNIGRILFDHSDYNLCRLATVSQFGWSHGRRFIAAFAEIIWGAFPQKRAEAVHPAVGFPSKCRTRNHSHNDQ